MDEFTLIRAIESGNLTEIDGFLHSGGNVYEALCKGMSPLMYAIEYACCKKSPSCSRDCDSSKDEFYYVGKVRYSYKYDEIIIRLITAGADVNFVRPHDKMTSLMLALQLKLSVNVINKLLDAGSDINVKCKKQKTPIMYAIENNYDKSLVIELINKSVDINHSCSMGWTALFYAAIFNKNPEIIKILINAGAKINTDEKSSCVSLCNPFGTFSMFINKIPEILKILTTASTKISLDLISCRASLQNPISNIFMNVNNRINALLVQT